MKLPAFAIQGVDVDVSKADDYHCHCHCHCHCHFWKEFLCEIPIFCNINSI